MSTAAIIGIKRGRTIRSIYCHNDGDLFGVGVILDHEYNYESKIEKLIEGGDISSLGILLTPDPLYDHSFDNPQPEVTVFYHRDRGDKWEDCQPMEASTIKLFTNQIGIQYYYLFDTSVQAWKVYGSNGKLMGFLDNLVSRRNEYEGA